MTFRTDMQDLVTELLAEFGTTGQLEFPTTGTYDASTRRATETLVLIDAATSVKTGHLRLNNQVEVARSADGRFAAEPGDDEIDGVDPSGARAIAAGTAAIVGLKNFADARFFNNVPYAPYLEFGTDKIAPRAMYARAAAAIEAKYQQVTLDPARGRVGLKGGNA